MVGLGETVTVKFCEDPAQAPVGVTVIVLTMGLVVLLVRDAIEILPEPLAGIPDAILLLFQVNALAVPVKTTFSGSPAHKDSSAGSLTLTPGLTVTVKVRGVPTQPVEDEGVTVIVVTSCEVTNAVGAESVLPVPLAGMPAAGLLLVHE